MDQNVVFKTATVGGFEKRAVLDYIYKMNADMETEREDFLSQIETLRLEVEEVKNNSGSSEETTQKINNDLRTTERDLAKVSNELTEEKTLRLELGKENELLKAQIKELENLIEKLKIEKSTVVDNEKYLELEAKREEIERASYQVGRVLLDARADADNLIEKATEQAQTLRQKAEAEVAVLREKAKKESDEFVESSKQKALAELSLAKQESERIFSETDSEVKLRKSTTKDELQRIIESAKSHIAEIVSTTEVVAKDSTEKLEVLEKDSNIIRSAFTATLKTLNDHVEEIHKGIIEAKNKIVEQQRQISSLEMLDTARLHLDELSSLADIKIESSESVNREKSSEAILFVEETEPETQAQQEVPVTYTQEKDEDVQSPSDKTDEAQAVEAPFDSNEFKSGIFSKETEGFIFETEPAKEEGTSESEVGKESTLLSNIDE